METRNWIKEFDDKFKGRVIDGWNPEGGDGMYLNKDGSSTPLQPELKRFIQSLLPINAGYCPSHKYFLNTMNNKIECGYCRMQPNQFE